MVRQLLIRFEIPAALPIAAVNARREVYPVDPAEGREEYVLNWRARVASRDIRSRSRYSDFVSDPLPDQALINEYRSGDEEAARRLFERYYTRLIELIRRQLVEMCRETAENSPGDKMPAVKIPADKKPAVKTPADKKTVQRYYPTQRLLDLAGIESLDDLPQTEDID